MPINPIRFSAITIGDIQPGVKLQSDTGHTFVPSEPGTSGTMRHSKTFGPMLNVKGDFMGVNNNPGNHAELIPSWRG